MAEDGTKWPKAVAKITDDLDVLLEFDNDPAEHWVHLRTMNPARVDLGHRSPSAAGHKGPGSRAAGVAMAFKLIESAQQRWRAVNAPTSSLSSGGGARFEKGLLVERPDESGGDQQVA